MIIQLIFFLIFRFNIFCLKNLFYFENFILIYRFFLGIFWLNNFLCFWLFLDDFFLFRFDNLFCFRLFLDDFFLFRFDNLLGFRLFLDDFFLFRFDNLLDFRLFLDSFLSSTIHSYYLFRRHLYCIIQIHWQCII